jgi:hypothetical protein
MSICFVKEREIADLQVTAWLVFFNALPSSMPTTDRYLLGAILETKVHGALPTC